MIIGFTGKLSSGKDTAAERLRGMVNVPTTRVAFADKLKESAAAALNVTIDDLNKWKNDPMQAIVICNLEDDDPRSVMTFREYLQLYGTEAHRQVFGDDFWVEQALPSNGDYERTVVTVTDVRFPNELEHVHKLGGIVVRVVGPDDGASAHDAHASEQVLEGVDWEINNRSRGDAFISLDSQLRMLLYSYGKSFYLDETYDAPPEGRLTMEEAA